LGKSGFICYPIYVFYFGWREKSARIIRAHYIFRDWPVSSKQNVLPVAGILSGALVWGVIWDSYGVFREGRKVNKNVDSIGLGWQFSKFK